MTQQDGNEKAAAAVGDPFESRLRGFEVRSPSGQTFIVKAAPRGVPLNADDAPSTSILVNLAWQVYLGVISAFSRRWKVGVLYRTGRFWKRDHVTYREILPRGVTPEQRLQELGDGCREGAFDR